MGRFIAGDGAAGHVDGAAGGGEECAAVLGGVILDGAAVHIESAAGGVRYVIIEFPENGTAVVIAVVAGDFATVHVEYAYVSIDTLSDTLCGKTRPIHFKGVCTVVSKLFNIVAPDRAYFGQKDAQQLAIIRKMVQDLNFDIQIVGCPIIREEDGLAKSSRNTYLSAEERKAALCLSRAVKTGQEAICKGIKAEEVLSKMRAVIEAEPLAKIDYVAMVDALDMQPVESVEKDVLVAMAVYIGKTRLIDNFSYEV